MSVAVLATFGLALNQFGPSADLAPIGKSWSGSHSKDPMVWVARVETFDSRTGGSCSEWKSALRALSVGQPIRLEGAASGVASDWQAWAPWSKDDVAAIEGCVSTPCKVKLEPREVALLKITLASERKARYRELVMDRLRTYLKSGERRRYERPEVPSDPWATLPDRGFRASPALPTQASFWIRKLQLGEGQLRPIRQVLDRRFAENANEATLWVRDVYTAHYFDSWGEWTSVLCEPAGNRIQIIQALQVEPDLLKKTDLISRMGRGRMRAAVSLKGKEYLQEKFTQLSRLARSPSAR